MDLGSLFGVLRPDKRHQTETVAVQEPKQDGELSRLQPAEVPSDSPAPPPGVKVTPDAYNQDGLISLHNHEFMEAPRFVEAYQRGVQAAGKDYRWHWRVHVGLWAADCASRLSGDFVECGVNYGFLSSAIMQYLDWDSLGKQFYLLDTFQGLDVRFVSEAERAGGIMEKNQKFIDMGFYAMNADVVRRNFSQWRNTCIVEGAIPETLERVESSQIAFLHIDLNCAPPEVAALRHFWKRLVPGAMVLLDDYAFRGYRAQKLAMDGLAAELGVPIVSLPTGQGLLVKV